MKRGSPSSSSASLEPYLCIAGNTDSVCDRQIFLYGHLSPEAAVLKMTPFTFRDVHICLFEKGSAVCDLQFFVDAGGVLFDGALCDKQNLCDIFSFPLFQNEAQDLFFPLGKGFYGRPVCQNGLNLRL